MYIFMPDLDISQYPMNYHINSIGDSDNVFQLHNTQENEDKNELYIAFPDEQYFQWF